MGITEGAGAVPKLFRKIHPLLRNDVKIREINAKYIGAILKSEK
jgi:hypothetical protein